MTVRLMLLHQKIWTEPQRMNPRLEKDCLSSKLLSIVTVYFFIFLSFQPTQVKSESAGKCDCVKVFFGR